MGGEEAGIAAWEISNMPRLWDKGFSPSLNNRWRAASSIAMMGPDNLEYKRSVYVSCSFLNVFLWAFKQRSESFHREHAKRACYQIISLVFLPVSQCYSFESTIAE